jgi:class 3 adenylate cyclase
VNWELVFHNHAPVDWRERYAISSWQQLVDVLARWEDYFEVLIVVADIRRSTQMSLAAQDKHAFTKLILDFVDTAWGIIRENGGWWDKFTGDGFIAFWLIPRGDAKQAMDARESRAGVLGGVAAMHSVFRDTVLPMLREISDASFPSDGGLVVGFDQGDVSLAVRTEDLLLLGPAIVEASRMADTASAGETIANVITGRELVESEDANQWVEAVAERRYTKEFPEGKSEGQQVYLLKFKTPGD